MCIPNSNSYVEKSRCIIGESTKIDVFFLRFTWDSSRLEPGNCWLGTWDVIPKKAAWTGDVYPACGFWWPLQVIREINRQPDVENLESSLAEIWRGYVALEWAPEGATFASRNQGIPQNCMWNSFLFGFRMEGDDVMQFLHQLSPKFYLRQKDAEPGVVLLAFSCSEPGVSVTVSSG